MGMTQTKKTDWTLDQLKRELSARKQVRAWIIQQEHTHRRERYFMQEMQSLVTDQDREVRARALEARIMVHLPGRPGRQGEISKKLFNSLPLAPQLDSAIEAALQTDHQAWELPTQIPPQQSPLPTSDPRMAEDLEGAMDELTQQIAASVSRKRDTIFNSAELFLSVHDRELHLSNGLTHRHSQSRAYVESAYSYTRKMADGETRADEYLNARWSVNMDDLKIQQLFDETSERARHSLDVSKPPSGRFSVIVDSEVLATLFNNQVSQLASANAYNGLPFIKTGENLISEAKGDLLTIGLDPHLEYGADTTGLSEHGVTQKPLKLVDRNRVIATLTDKRYADYTGSPVTTSRGNVVVEPGTLSHAELTRQSPHVIEILQFSGLFADANSGTYSSEIRLARLYENNGQEQKVTYLKGGSLSGSFTENFKNARLSSNRVKHAHFSSNSMQGHGYYGPDFALLGDVSIVG